LAAPAKKEESPLAALPKAVPKKQPAYEQINKDQLKRAIAFDPHHWKICKICGHPNALLTTFADHIAEAAMKCKR